MMPVREQPGVLSTKVALHPSIPPEQENFEEMRRSSSELPFDAPDPEVGTCHSLRKQFMVTRQLFLSQNKAPARLLP